jgi:hypothetical protein
MLLFKCAATGAAALLLSLFLAGCGGGGGGGTPVDPPSGIRIEGTTLAGRPVDLANISPGDQVQLRLIGFDTNNQEVVVNVDTWRIDGAAAAIEGDGILRATGASSGTIVAVTGITERTIALGIRNGLATLTGKARTAGGTVVPRTVLEFFNASGQVVGSIRTDAAGEFRTKLPTTATGFVAGTRDLVRFYNVFSYSGSLRTETIAGCRAPLPGLTSGVVRPLVADVVMWPVTGAPPPPPTGCF